MPALAVARLTGTRKLGAHVRAQRDKRKVVSAVERQLDDAPVLDDGADRRILGRDERRFPGDRGGLRQRAHLHGQIQTQRLLHVQIDGLSCRLEARKLSLHRIASWRQRWETIDAGGVGLRVACRIRPGVLRRDTDAWE